jgi:hypothetical protein
MHQHVAVGLKYTPVEASIGKGALSFSEKKESR